MNSPFVFIFFNFYVLEQQIITKSWLSFLVYAIEYLYELNL